MLKRSLYPSCVRVAKVTILIHSLLSVLEMYLLERCLYSREMSVLEREKEICIRKRCLYWREMSVLERDVCVRERCLY